MDKQKRMVDNITKAFDRMMCELKGSTLTDHDFNEIALRTNRFVQELYMQRSHASLKKNREFTEALTTLRKIRSEAAINTYK